MEDFLKFIASPNGRWLRVAAGLSIIGTSALRKEKINWPLLLIGLVPLSAGLLDKCVLAPLAGKPFSGEQLRKQLGSD